MKSYLGNTTAPRGIRNNNPGNLIITGNNWVGKINPNENTDGHFEQFRSIEYGLRALAIHLVNRIEAGKNTLEQIITEFAPPSENNTKAYIASVSQATGLKPTEPIKLTDKVLKELVKAFIRVENGTAYSQYVDDSTLFDSIKLLPSKILDKIKTAAVIGLPIILVILAALYYTNEN